MKLDKLEFLCYPCVANIDGEPHMGLVARRDADKRATLAVLNTSGAFVAIDGVPFHDGPAAECPPGHYCWVTQGEVLASAQQDAPTADATDARADSVGLALSNLPGPEVTIAGEETDGPK